MSELRLKEYRKRLNMSQKAVSELVNVTQQAYSYWEIGSTFPNPSQIRKLCEIFKCTPNDLFGFKGVYLTELDKIDSK